MLLYSLYQQGGIYVDCFKILLRVFQIVIFQASEPTERFLGYVHARQLTGVALSNAIIKHLVDSGLNLAYLFGQGYDGAAAMAGEFILFTPGIYKMYSACMHARLRKA